jgi:hypothetical protein
MSEVEPVVDIEKHPHDKETAFSRVEEWIARNFRSADDVIQMKDLEEGTIIAQGVREGSPWGTTAVKGFEYTLSVDVRDQKMRLSYKLRGWIDYPTVRKGDIDNMKRYYKQDLKPEMLKFVRQEDTF